MRIIITGQHPVSRLGVATLLRSLVGAPIIHDFDTATEGLDAARQDPVDLFFSGASTGAALGPAWIQDLVDAVRPGKVVILSATLDRRVCQMAYQAGTWGHLPMTGSVEMLTAAIRLIVAGGTYFPALHPMVLRGGELAESPSPNALLSRRQRQVLVEIEHGRSNKEIAVNLGISVPTVKLHVQAILRALDAKNRTEAARLARGLDLTG